MQLLLLSRIWYPLNDGDDNDDDDDDDDDDDSDNDDGDDDDDDDDDDSDVRQYADMVYINIRSSTQYAI